MPVGDCYIHYNLDYLYIYDLFHGIQNYIYSYMNQ